MVQDPFAGDPFDPFEINHHKFTAVPQGCPDRPEHLVVVFEMVIGVADEGQIDRLVRKAGRILLGKDDPGIGQPLSGDPLLEIFHEPGRDLQGKDLSLVAHRPGKEGQEEEIVELATGINVELDGSGELIGVELFNASALLKDVIKPIEKKIMAY